MQSATWLCLSMNDLAYNNQWPDSYFFNPNGLIENLDDSRQGTFAGCACTIFGVFAPCVNIRMMIMMMMIIGPVELIPSVFSCLQ